ncbi:ribonuclease E/G [Pseudooceanicola nanhaiensis]|uniref:ribonuclease E/G n=1 Tax=Pseudooceanicola nanhaiensis TaxID=375761 RepID=UPI001CD4E7BF|nr:ribonuclease E/G [Pseudooceanicola nanhaiensis]MCA0919235.1 ribonuclease E/G [Pseudooceanicola nanhaiensis]
MKGAEILLGEWQGREAAALMRDGQLEDLLIDGDAPRPGSIYRARTDRPVKGQGGMFLATPDGSAFLRQVKGLAPGAPLLVQVTGYAEPGKAIPVTQRLLFKSRYAIVTPEAPGLNVSRAIRDEEVRDELLATAHETWAEAGAPEGAGLILRSACAEASAEEVIDDILAMAALATQVLADLEGAPELLVEGDGPHALAWRDWSEPAQVTEGADALERDDVAGAIEALAEPEVPLPGGGTMVVEPTKAFVAVDVNTGGDTSPAAGLKANTAAARELPRQLRLRGLGGVVILDPAPMPKKDRRGFEGSLRAAFRADDVETNLSGWTPLGNYELQRKRARLPLAGGTA